ncbi:MAG: DHA2 family efflux MFS transporter permease subunit [Solirubrobacterales bacterium]|nr:DHA2 family efflux MFS transporter permease subunit [Solirubrobacterales bacterium]
MQSHGLGFVRQPDPAVLYDGCVAETSAQAATPEGLDRETLVVAGVVLLGAVMSILDTTVVNVAIDHLAVAFHSSLTTIQWVITGYTLALAAVIPSTGWAADRFGTKRIYMTSLVLFTLGSVLSGLAWSAESLIVFRVLQGVGGGMIMPAVMTIMTKKAGPHRMGRVMGVLGVPMLIAPIMGPILGGWLVDSASWRWIFFINVPIGIVAFVLALIVLDRDESQPAHRLDWLGMLLLSPGLAVFIFGLAESSTYGFGSLRSWGPTLLGVVLIAAWFVHSWRSPNPLIDLRTFAHTRAGAAAGTFLLFAISVFGSMLLVPLYYQAVRNASALQAGLLMAPGGLGAMLLMPLAGRLTDRYGPTWLPATGLPLVAIALIPFVFVGPHTSYVLLCSASFVQGLGMGLAMMPNMTAAMQAVPAAAIARTSTAMNIIRQAGASIGTAVLSVILASAITSNLGTIIRSHAGGSGSGGIGTLQRLPASAHAAIARPLANAFGSTFTWALVMILVALIPAVGMAISGWRRPVTAPVGGRPVVVE